MNFFSSKEQPVSLDKVRETLIRLEDTIIFALIERAQFAHNAKIYEPKDFDLEGQDFDGSFMEWMLRETEVIHAKARRFTSPDENPFFPDLPAPILPALAYPDVLHRNTVNVNADLLRIYEREIVPALCKPGDDLQYGSSATKDVDCLQLLSRRIHYGKFVAEAKFTDPKYQEKYVALIKAGDTPGIEELLTNRAVEERVVKRLRKKAAIYGQDIVDDDGGAPNGTPGSPTGGSGSYKIDLDLVVRLYEKYVIPLTKRVEVEYLMQRLDP
ncbi:chorismate mutase [Hyaloraphidium curvatum]|nr:chorismate mutase [Hyaloraphidium curvatum]